MDIHAYSQLWMTPWGYKKADPGDNGEMVSRRSASSLPSTFILYFFLGEISYLIMCTLTIFFLKTAIPVANVLRGIITEEFNTSGLFEEKNE